MQLRALIACLTVLAVLFGINIRYAYPASTTALPQLTSRHVVDPRFSGTTFSVIANARQVRATSRGILFMQLHEPIEDIYFDVPVFPSLGCLPAVPGVNDRVRITGNLGFYGGVPQIKPLSAGHVEVLPTGSAAPLTPLAQAVGRTGSTLRVGPLRVVRIAEFTSRAKLKHLRVWFASADLPRREGDVVQGILFAGDWTHCDFKLLRSGRPVAVDAQVETYQGEPSLNVKRVTASE